MQLGKRVTDLSPPTPPLFIHCRLQQDKPDINVDKTRVGKCCEIHLRKTGQWIWKQIVFHSSYIKTMSVKCTINLPLEAFIIVLITVFNALHYNSYRFRKCVGQHAFALNVLILMQFRMWLSCCNFVGKRRTLSMDHKITIQTKLIQSFNMKVTWEIVYSTFLVWSWLILKAENGDSCSNSPALTNAKVKRWTLPLDRPVKGTISDGV